MSYKLKPAELTNLLLSRDFSPFVWLPSDKRVLRYDQFVEDMNEKYSIVDWSEGTEAKADEAKIDLFRLAAGNKLREVINTVIRGEHKQLQFSQLIVKVRESLVQKSFPPLLALGNVLAMKQHPNESFESYYERVEEEAKVVHWDGLNTKNIRNAIIATALACGSVNPYVKGHCLAVRDLDAIKFDDVLLTAAEYEEKSSSKKNAFPAITQNQGGFFLTDTSNNRHGSGGLFGASSCNGNAGSGGLFGSRPPANNQAGGGLFGCSTQKPKTPLFSFGKPKEGGFGSANNDNVSFEEQRAFTFGAATAAATSSSNTPTTPFGSSKVNIFMTKKKDSNEVPVTTASSSSSTEVEPEQQPKEKRQRVESKDNI